MMNILCVTVLVETSPQALPMGAACIASALKNDSNLEDKVMVCLADYSLEGKLSSSEEIAEDIIKSYEDTGIYCFSIYVWNRIFIEEIASIIRKHNPSAVIIGGGPEVTANPMSFSHFDYTVSGEGELSVPLLIESLLKGETVKEDYRTGFAFGIQGVYDARIKYGDSDYKDDNMNTVGVKGDKALSLSVIRSLPPKVETLASPYLDGTLNPSEYGGVLWELARGCPFKCSYCYESKGEKKIQFFSRDRLEKELDLFARLKIPQAFVLDPTYNANKKKALDMLRLIKQKTPDMFFYFEARAEFIDRELARAFASIRCCLQIGLQSAHPEVLQKVHRTLDKKLFVRNVGFLNDEGAVFGFDLIYGLPGDNLAGFKSSIDFAVSLYPNNIELFCLSVLPGTDLYEQGTELGLTWQKNPPYHVVDSTSFCAAELSKASRLAKSANMFYTQGRAVPWFITILNPLHEKASRFFEVFADYMGDNLDRSFSHKEIEGFQKKYVARRYREKHLDRMLDAATDLISLNGALSRCTSDCEEGIVDLHYHPDDLMSEYGSDLDFFSRNAGTMKCRAKVFSTPQGPDWKKI